MKLHRRLNRGKQATPKQSLDVMGWDDAIMLALAAAQTASALNPPENNFQNPAGAGSTQMPSGGSPLQPQQQQQPQQGAPGAAPGVQPINTEPLTNLAAELAKSGPPPSAQTQAMPTTQGLQPQQKPQIQSPYPTGGAPDVAHGPPNPATDPVAQQAATNSIWASLPKAIAAAAPLLGAGGQETREHAAPPTGGNLGANAFQSPVRRPTIGEILNSLPRYR